MAHNRKELSNWALIKLAWKISKGWRGVVNTLDFYLALGAWILTSHYWLNEEWWTQVIGVLPNVLGFTLGGFAIFLGFGSDGFKRMLAGEDEVKDSPYLSVSSAFLMFVWVQLLAILYALCAGALNFSPPHILRPYADYLSIGTKISDGIGYLLFLYSLILALRAALRIFRLSRWYNDFLVFEERQEAAKAAPPKT